MDEEKQAAFIDVALTLRAGACTYMVVLAMYLNTLLFVALHYKVVHTRRLYRAPTTVYGPPPVEPRVEEKKSEPQVETFMKFEEQKTQTQEREQEEEEGKEKEKEEKEKVEKPEKKKERSREKTLKSARMSIRLPRAPKGHHVEELDQMEKFLAEDDTSDIGKVE